ncbi:hypothetical protein HY310_00765 [Candidatus Microgenomates bacterium]|nr:hypothetical protein [Candidatus Microgenomates bacterium]
MIWKQPIPTNLKDLTKGNLFAATVFAELIRRGANSDTEIILEGNWLNVSRGQCICGRFELAKCFGLKENESGRIQRILNKLEKTYKLIDKRKSLNCTIVTIKNYDELICFDQSNKSDATNRRPIDNQSTDTNKSVKNEESVERDINPTNNFPP